eukprot:SAG22_NODE_1444_length_4412_cov_2.784605_1_plen_108_part_00
MVSLTKKNGGMPDYANWIVLLCDGDDNKSRVGCKSVVRQLQDVTSKGIVKGLISIAAGISGSSLKNIRELAEATESGMMVETSDAGIGAAFGKAAMQIEAGGLSESL